MKILDTLPEQEFDRLIRLATTMLQAPIGLLSLIDEHRQWFKAAQGLIVRETLREWAFCDHAIGWPEKVLVVPDAREEAWLQDNPLVYDEPNIRFYAGAPIVTRDGFPVGTLCVIDTVPREGLTPDQEQVLRDLAACAANELEARFHRNQDHELRLYDFSRASGDWFWESDREDRFTWISDHLDNQTAGHSTDLLGRRREDLIAKTATAHGWEEYRNAITNRRPFRDFIYCHDRSGEMRWYKTSGVPCFDADGEFAGYRGVACDITATLEFEAEAKQTIEMLETALDAINEAFIVCDADDRIVYTNKVFRELNQSARVTWTCDLRFEDFLRSLTSHGLIADAIGQEEAWIAERMAWHRDPGELLELKRTDGLTVLISEKKLATGGTVTVTMDISTLKQTERELRESRQRLQDFADTAADWFWEQDADLRFTYATMPQRSASGPLADMTGLTRDELGMTSVSEDARAVYNARLANREPIEDFRFALELPDGDELHVTISGKPIFEDGIFKGYRGSGRDITPLVEAETRLRKALDLANRANQSKSHFLANMSHELRTPLNSILGFSELMSLEAFGPLGSQRYRDYAGDIHGMATHLLQLINDILDIERIEAGHVELDVGVVSLRAIAEGVIRTLGQEANRKSHRLVLDFPEHFPEIRADSRMCSQILTNLVANAIKYTPDNGRIVVRGAIGPNGTIGVSVSDNGIGMRAKDIPRALEEFGQVRPDSHVAHDGVGLGLPLSKRLVELHGGGIAIDSAPGIGTTVEVRFPAERRVAG